MFKIIVYSIFVLYFVQVSTSVDYCDIEKNSCKGLKHIGCGAVEYAKNCKAITITDEVQAYILDIFNAARSMLAKGELNGYEAAAALPELQWNKELAYLAELNTASCKVNLDECRVSESYPNYGQFGLLATASADTYEVALRKSFDKAFERHENGTMEHTIKLLDSDVDGPTAFFRRIVSDRTFVVGCGISEYQHQVVNRTSYMLTCNANFNKNEPVYQPGDPCSLCENGCSKKYPTLCLSANEETKEEIETPKKPVDVVQKVDDVKQPVVVEPVKSIEADASVALKEIDTKAIETGLPIETTYYRRHRIGPVNNFMFFGSGLDVTIHNYN